MGAAQYIILANLCIAVLLGFYVIFLKKETFFQLNRVYLLGSLGGIFYNTLYADQLG